MQRTALRSDPAKTLAWRRRSKGLARGAGPAGKTRLKPVSAKRREREREWAALKAQAIAERGDVCEAGLTGCVVGPCDAHHMAGRLRQSADVLLLVCRSCHEWITNNSKAACAMGLSITRNGVTT